MASFSTAGTAEVESNSSELIQSLEELDSAWERALGSLAKVDACTAPRGDDPALQSLLRKAARCYEECAFASRRLGVFSKNESVEDVSTESLKYVLANYEAGRLYLRMVGTPGRVPLVQRALGLLSAFVEQCDRMGLLDAAEVKRLNHQADEPANGDARQAKIARFKRQRDAERRMAALEESRRKSRAIDEDIERESVLLAITVAICVALDDIDSSSRELQMLGQMEAMRLQEQQRGAAAAGPNAIDSTSAGRDGGGTEGPPKPAGLSVTHIGVDGSVRREVLKSQVFRQSWRSPTMTLEELAEIEMHEAMERSRREDEAPKKALKYKQLEEQGKEDDAALVDKATVRDREWDDWKDDHPKGAGVTKRF